MGTKVNSNYEDLITFTRASKGHALRPVSYGDELVTNGTFTSNINDWTNTNDVWVYDNGQARAQALGFEGATTALQQDISTTVNGLYELTIDISDAGGGYLLVLARDASNVNITNASTGNITAEGSYRFLFYAPTSTVKVTVFAYAGSTAAIDNVSVKEVLFDQPDGTLTLFEHPENVPRVEYDADGNRLGLLVEEQRTNNYQYSEDFNNSYYNVKIRTRTLEATQTGPDGLTSAYVFGDDSSGGTDNILLGKSSVSLVINTTYTWSVFAKKDGLNWLSLSCVDFGGVANGYTHFDLENGAVGSTQNNITAKIQEYPDGWYRCSVTFTTNGTDATGNLYMYLAEADGDRIVDLDGTSSILIYGAQLEAGSFPTSYMKNEGTVSGEDRSADVASIPVADFGFNANEGTLFVNCLHFGDASERPLSMSDGSNTSQAFFKIATGSDPISQVVTAGVNIAQLDTTSARDSGYKAAMTVKENDFAVSVDGNSVAVDTNGGIGTYSIIHIGRRQDGLASTLFNGHIKSIKYYPRRLTNAQLQDLTS